MKVMKSLVLCFVLLCGAVGLVAQNTPEWQWAVGAGGTGDDAGQSIAIDSQGNQYVTGEFYGTASFGSETLTASGDEWPDIFVAKLDPAGNWLWAVKAGGTSSEQGFCIALDGVGNPYVTGRFQGSATFGNHILTANDNRDIFAAKLDPDGNWLWAVKAGGTGYDVGYGIAVDGVGNIFVTGYFQYTATFGSQTLSTSGGIWDKDIFAAKLDPDGNWLWAVKAGGTDTDVGYGIPLDGAGNAYVTGVFYGTASFGSETLTASGDEWPDIYVAKLDPDGNWLWAIKAGGVYEDCGYDIALDALGNAYVTGYFKGTATFGSHSLTTIGEYDIFAAKLDPDGNWLWAVNAGGTGWVRGYEIAVDGLGNACVTGEFSGTATLGNHNLTGSGGDDILVAKLDPSGNWLWAVQAGGRGWDQGYGIAVDGAGNAYVTGSFEDTAFFGSHSLTAIGRIDIFAAKLAVGTPVEDDLAPEAVARLYNAWPNPLGRGASALIKADIAERSTGTLSIYNLRGQIVARYQLGPGTHQISFGGGELSAGVYLYSLQCGAYRVTRKLVLLK